MLQQSHTTRLEVSAVHAYLLCILPTACCSTRICTARCALWTSL